MENEDLNQNLSQNPDTQRDVYLGGDITSSQEQKINLNQPPKSLVDWLVRVHLRLMALENEKSSGSS